jgi:hypothetical protein
MADEVLSNCPACQAAVPAGADECPKCGLNLAPAEMPHVSLGTTHTIGVPDVGEQHFLSRAFDSDAPIAKVGVVLFVGLALVPLVLVAVLVAIVVLRLLAP